MNKTTKKGFRTLFITKKMAEDLTDFYEKISGSHMHSDIDSVERAEILEI